MLVHQHGLALGPLELTRGRKVDTRGREGERSERTISQIIWKDYRGFSQIMLSTEGETDQETRKRLAFLSCKPYNIFNSDSTDRAGPHPKP